MKYLFVEERADYSDLSAGRVFLSAPGFTPFPVRLASEIFQRCLNLRAGQGYSEPCVLYDPCCGSGYLLAVLTFLHHDTLRHVAGSDINPDAVQLAERNLALLTPQGIVGRIDQIEAMLAEFGKLSHQEALESATRIQQQVNAWGERAISSRVFIADALDSAAVARGLHPLKADVVITDVPYGQHSAWSGAAKDANPITPMLDALHGILSDGAIVAIASDKGQKASHAAYRRLAQLQIGKRRIVFLTPLAAGGN